MNCHRARQLISPFLDQRLTGREMLALQQHFDECATCEAERHSIRQVKMLLRALHDPRPRAVLPGAISARIAEADRPLWRTAFLSEAPAWRPQRGRRLATALALSCVTVLSFTAACFAPAPSGAALSSSAFLPATGLPAEPPMSASQAGLVPLSDVPGGDFLSLAEAGGARRGRPFTAQYEAPPDARLSPLAAGSVPDYAQGQVSFAGYRTR